MERQIKKAGNFVPRFFKAFSLYLIMTLLVFFGYVQLFGKMEAGPITLPILGASAEEDNYFADFVQSFSKFKNIDANFDLTVKNGNINFSAKDSRVAFDMENQEFAFETLLNYNSQSFAVSAVYADSCLHLSLNEKNYKFDTTNVPDLDMSGVLDFAMNTINIDTDEILSKVSAIIGVDLSKIDSTTILSSLDTKEEVLDDGSYKFNIKFGKLEAILYCDKDFNITSAKAQHSTLGGISLIADVSAMNSEDFAIEFESHENEIELDGLMEYVSYAKELEKKDIVSADLSLNVSGENYGGTLTVDKTSGLKVKFELNQGVNALIVYVDNVVYAQIENVKVKFNVDDYNKFKDVVDKTIQNVTSMTTTELITNVIESLFKNGNSDNNDFNVDEFVSDVTSNLDLNGVMTYLPDEAVMTNNQYAMIWNTGLNIVLTQNGGVLNGAKITYNDFALNADIYDGNAIEFDEQGFYDVASLLPVADVINAITEAKQLGGVAKLDFNGFEVEAEYYFDFANQMKGVISLEMFSQKFEIYFVQEVDDYRVIVSIGEIVIEGKYSEIDSYKAQIESIFGKFTENQTSLEVEQVVKAVFGVLNQISLRNDANAILVVEYLSNLGSLQVNCDNAVVSILNDKVKAEISIGATNKVVVVPSEITNTFAELLQRMKNVKDLITSDNFAFDASFVGENVDLNAKVQIDNKNKSYEVFGVVNEIKFDVRYVANIVYIAVYANGENYKFKVETESLSQAVEVVNKILIANGVSAENVDALQVLLSLTQNSDIDFAETLSKIQIAVSGNLDDINVKFAYDKFDGNVNVLFANDNLDKVVLTANNNMTIEIDVCECENRTLNTDEYFNLTSGLVGEVEISYNDISVIANIEVDLTDGIYLKLTTNVFGADVEVLVLDNKLYVSLDELKYKSNLYNASEIIEIFKQMFGESQNKIETRSENEVTVEQILKMLSNFDITLTNEKLELYGQVEGVNIIFTLSDEQRITRSKAPKNCDDLKKLALLAKNIMTYINNGVYEFDFAVEYNGLILDGTFKYSENIMEIIVLDLFGENLQINIQDNYIFVNYANMKFKVAIPQNKGNSDFDLTNVLNTLTSDKLGVDIDFGGLQTVIDMLSEFTVKDYVENLKLTATANEITLTLNYTGKGLADLVINIADNKLSSVDVSCFVLSGRVIVNYVEKSSINAIVASEYENYTNDIVDGLLDSFNISEGVYAFSTNLAVRYSTNQFYGNLVGLLIKDDSHKGLINGYIPAVALYTSSLGLDSYIYLVDNAVYVSIAGLQVYADINETTINDIMDLVSKFTSTEVAETVDAFRVCLPSLTEIYGQWVYEITEESQSKIGVQIDIKDSLYYTSQARFYDIVAKVIMQKDGNKLLPSDITLGANIEDPNTKLNENGYKDYLLKINDDLIEDYNLTGNLNFAIYLYNLTAGSASTIANNFAFDESGELKGFVINNVVTNISEFKNYTELLPLLSAYDYFTSYNYQLGLSGKVASESQIIKINNASDITVKLSPLTDESIFDNTDDDIAEKVMSWFDNNYLKVLGDIDINIQNLKDSSDVQHKLSVFYESNDSSELYLSYSHGDLIGNKEFNGRVKNSNLSTLVSMIVSLMGMEMDEKTMASWGLEPCTTDFAYLQKLLNIDTSKNEDNSDIDNLLQSISNITNVLGSVGLETSEKDTDGNFTTTLSINLKEIFGENASVSVVVSNNEKDEVVTSKLEKLVISGVSVGGMAIDLEISIDEFKEENFNYDTTKEHIDLSSITEFMDVAVSTLNTQSMAFNGNTSIGIFGIDAITVYYDMLVELSDSGDVSLYFEMVVPSFVDVTYNAGGFGNTYTVYSAYGFDKRVSTLEYKDGVLNLVQNTYGNKYTGWAAWKKRDEQITKSWKADEIGSHIMEIFAYMLGLTDTVYNKIGDLIASMNPRPTLEQTIMSYAPMFTTINGLETLTGFSMGLEGETLTGDANFDDLNVQIDMSDAYVVNGKEFRFIETVSTKIGIKNDFVSIPLKLNSTTGESYVTTGGKTIYSNDYYRKQYLKKFA